MPKININHADEPEDQKPEGKLGADPDPDTIEQIAEEAADNIEKQPKTIKVKTDHEEDPEVAEPKGEGKENEGPDPIKEDEPKKNEEPPEPVEETVEEPEADAETPAEAADDAPEEENAEEAGETEAVEDAPDEDLPSAADEHDQDLEEAIHSVESENGDALLAHEDLTLEEAAQPEPKKSLADHINRFFAVWWHSSPARWATFLLLLAAIVAAGTVPSSRYYVLNTAGVRAEASMTVLDDKTQQPLKNVHVLLQGQDKATNSQGSVTFDKLKLGPSTFIIQKRAFATSSQKVVLGLGSNPLGNYQITAVGSHYSFVVTDWLSKKPLAGAEASSGDGNAVADKNGKIVLVLDTTNDDAIDVKLTYDKYRDENLHIASSQKTEMPVAMVPAKKHFFVSNRSGRYDVYKIDADGKNEQLLMPGTGQESDNMVLAPQPAGKQVAVVTTRDGQRNSDGFLLSGLYIINVATGESQKIAQSERVQIIDWYGDRIVYVAVAQGASAADPNRQKLMTYDTVADESKKIASANYFNDVLSASGKIYFAPSNTYSQNPDNNKLFVVNPDGSNLKSVLDQETWNIFRVDYDKLAISVQQTWYNYTLGGSAPTKANGPPAQLKTKVFVDNDDHSKALWVDQRDGKGVLILRDTQGGTDKVLLTKAGLNGPVRWLTGDYITYRVSNTDETADYVLSLQGGDPMKIKDVSNIGGVDKWYYY